VLSLIADLLNLYLLIMFLMIILSWFPSQPGTTLATVQQVLWRLTNPVLAPIRRVIPGVRFGGSMLDLSPLIVIFAITIIRGFL
jgi:YggT family protein